ncbi:MLX-interacting protein [Papilio machaon]|uniref:MLX-interacting protein n=1 Tax=Papilio machaon TaxID=76193 RepID=A0A194RC34_PAPMA|nr:MLX-interacting protein [Papilio machaon]
MTHVEKHQTRTGKETIHSGHFMVSHFEAEDQDDFDDLAVPVPDEEQTVQKNTVVAMYTVPGSSETYTLSDKEESKQHQQLSIEISLTKLFKCMSLAYRQKLTSPKWNRFKGIKLRWKDKIRLNNVIWRCWHMQFIKKQNTFVCQFASPLDVDTHVKPETTILEGKYWKRRAEAVIAEYKKWRMFHIMRLLGKGDSSVQDTMSDMDTVESFSQCSDLAANMLTDEDYLNFMSDTLFSTITNHQPFAFPDCREIARGAGLADFIQPSLGPLQPNLDDFMDTLEPLQDLLSMPRLPPVPEETTIPSEDALYRSGMSVDSYNPQGYIAGSQNTSAVTMPTSQMSIHGTSNNTQLMSMPEQVKGEEMRMYDNSRLFTQTNLPNSIISGQEMHSAFPQSSYERPPAPQPDCAPPLHANAFVAKSPRVQFVATQKISPQPDAYKYNAGIPPSQTAPETVSLLQQPVQNTKYASTIIIQGRSGYSREKPRTRINHYTNQIGNNQYPAYSANITAHSAAQSAHSAGHTVHGTAQATHSAAQAVHSAAQGVHSAAQGVHSAAQGMHSAAQGVHSAAQAVHGATQGYEPRAPAARPPAAQMQYLQLNHVDPYKAKAGPSPTNVRSFKLPSPPLAPAPAHSQVAASGSSSSVPRNKEQFRSHSLPLGAQLSSEWVVSAGGTAEPAAAPGQVLVAPQDASPVRHTPRTRESSGALRLRSRSTSGGLGEPRRVPPPLSSVASEPALPQASVMLAHLLSAHHSQNLYTIKGKDEGAGGSEPTKSPIRRAQPSPIENDVMSPHQSLSPPASPTSPRAGSPRESREARRSHLHTEQKRRYNIKNGFDTLQTLIPHLNTNPTAKISKAAMLQKGAEYIKQLKAERNQIKEEMESLRAQIDCLNNSISNCHSMLPATGAPVSRARAGRLREMFARHVANRTMHNWKYWLFSVVSAALVESFSACVSCGSGADLVRTTLLWAEQHCSLVEMRPAVLNSLRVLCTTTDILTSPERLPEEARAAAAAGAGVKREPT